MTRLAAVAAIAVSVGTSSLASASPEQLVQRFEQCRGFFDASKWDQLKQCYSPDATYYVSGDTHSSGPQVDAIIATDRNDKDAFPDEKGEVQLELVDGNTIVAVTLLIGTHSGSIYLPADLLGLHDMRSGADLHATHRRFGYYTSQVLELGGDGTVLDERRYFDRATLYRQLKPDRSHPARPVLGKLPMPKVTAIARHDQVEQANRELATRGFAAFTSHDRKTLAELVADDAVVMIANEPNDRNKARLVAGAEALWKRFPDVRITVGHQWAAGAYVATEARVETATNDLEPQTPHLLLDVLVIEEVADGKIHRAWVFAPSSRAALQVCEHGELPCPPARK